MDTNTVTAAATRTSAVEGATWYLDSTMTIRRNPHPNSGRENLFSHGHAPGNIEENVLSESPTTVPTHDHMAVAQGGPNAGTHSYEKPSGYGLGGDSAHISTSSPSSVSPLLPSLNVIGVPPLGQSNTRDNQSTLSSISSLNTSISNVAHATPAPAPFTPKRHKIKPNSHPYAIITTSTGNLSRFNTLRPKDGGEDESKARTSSNAGEARKGYRNSTDRERLSAGPSGHYKHYVPLVSPGTPSIFTASEGSGGNVNDNVTPSGGMGRAGGLSSSTGHHPDGTWKLSGRHRHEYSESLADPPRPLPIPPQWTGASNNDHDNDVSGNAPGQGHRQERPRTRSHLRTQRTGETHIQSQQVQAQVHTAINPNLLPTETMIPQIGHPLPPSPPHPQPISSGSNAWSSPRVEDSLVHSPTPIPVPAAPPSPMGPNVTGNVAKGGETLPTPIPTPPLPETVRGHSHQPFSPSRLMQAQVQVPEQQQAEGNVYHVNGQSFTIQTIKPFHTGSSYGGDGADGRRDDEDEDERMLHASASIIRSPLLRPTSSMSTATMRDDGPPAGVEKQKYQFPLTPITPYESSATFPINHSPNYVAQSFQFDDPSLPSNPKEWSPEHLKSYLYRALGTTDDQGHGVESNSNTVIGESSELKNVLTFVGEKQINGKVFLRLDDGDLERYGVDPLWRAALLNASRVLRMNMLQGQVLLGFSNSEYYLDGEHEQHDSTSGDLTSPPLPAPHGTAMLPTPSPGFDEAFGVGQENGPKLTLGGLEMDDLHARSYAPPSPLPHSPRHMKQPIAPDERAGEGAVEEVQSREGANDTVWNASDVSGPSTKEEELGSSGHVGERSRHIEGGDYEHVPPKSTQESQGAQATHQELLEQESSRQPLSGVSEASSSFSPSSTSSAFSIRSASPTRDDHFSSPAYSLARSESQRQPQRSPRQLRLDRSGAVKHKKGRVKGMVESFEKVASFDELMESPTNSEFSGDGLSRSESTSTRIHHRNQSSISSTASNGGFSVSSGIGGPSGASLSRNDSMSHHHRRSQDRHHFNELVAPSIVGGTEAMVGGYLNRGRSGSMSSNASNSGDEYGWKDTHSYTLVTKKDGRPLPVPPTWTSPLKVTRTGNGVGLDISGPVKGSHWVRNDRRNSQQETVGVGLGIAGIEEEDSIYQRPLPQPPPWLGSTSAHNVGLPTDFATIKPVQAHLSGNASLRSFASTSDVLEMASEEGSNDLGSVRQVSSGPNDAIGEQIEGGSRRHEDLEQRWEADDPIHATVRHLDASPAVGVGDFMGSGPQYTQQPQLPSHSTIVTPNDSPTSHSMAQPPENPYVETRSGAPPTLAHYENRHPPFPQGLQADKPTPEVSAEAQPEIQHPIPQRPHQLSPSKFLHSRALPIPPTSIRSNTNTKGDEEEELTMEELLASMADNDPMPGAFSEKSGQAGGIGGLGIGSGAIAWELADKMQGVTVKRIPVIDVRSVQHVEAKKGHKKSPSTAVTLKDGGAPFIVADPKEPAEPRTSIQFSEDITDDPQEEFDLRDGEERGRAVVRGSRVKGKSGAKSGSTKEVGAEKRVGISEIFAPPAEADILDRRSPHLEKARAREREREDYKEIGERPDRYRHGKKISTSEKQFREELARATEELEREKQRREQEGTKEDYKEGREEDEVIKRLREDMENTKKMVKAVQARVEEVERNVAQLEAREIRHEQDTSTSQSADVVETTEDEQMPSSSSWSSLWSSPQTLARRMLGIPTPHSTDQNKPNGSGHRPQHKHSHRASTSRIPSYVLFVGIGVAAVVLKLVFKRYLVRGVAGR